VDEQIELAFLLAYGRPAREVRSPPAGSRLETRFTAVLRALLNTMDSCMSTDHCTRRDFLSFPLRGSGPRGVDAVAAEGRAARRTSGKGQARHPSLPVRRSQSTRFVRLQAGAGKAPRPTAWQRREARRVFRPGRPAAEERLGVQAARQERPVGLRLVRISPRWPTELTVIRLWSPNRRATRRPRFKRTAAFGSTASLPWAPGFHTAWQRGGRLAGVCCPADSRGLRRGTHQLVNGFLSPSTGCCVPKRGADRQRPLPHAEDRSGCERAARDLQAKLNEIDLADRGGNDELAARMKAYELAPRCSWPCPASPTCRARMNKTRELYGLNREETRRLRRSCLLARRLLEQGVRFVQLFSGVRSLAPPLTGTGTKI